MIKYNFRYVSTDNYELSYTSVKGEEKTIPFRRTIAMAKKIQGVQATARLKMYQELTEQGITKNDLIIKKVNGDGTITYDETNYRLYEEEYVQIQSALILNEVVETCFNMSISDLLLDMGIDPNTTDKDIVKQVELFSKEFTTIIGGKDEIKSPSISN